MKKYYKTPGGYCYCAAEKAHRANSTRLRNLQVAMLCFIVPVTLFAAVFAVTSIPLRCEFAWLIWAALILGMVLVGPCAYIAVLAIWKKLNNLSSRQPTWYVFLAVTTAAALGAALVLGELNYQTNIRPWCDLHTLIALPDVDAGRPGTQYMDASHVFFKQGTRLDLSRAVSFMDKGKDQHCVAPIVTGNESTNAQHDFWAVGIHCCAGKPADFHCGEYNNVHTISGLRLFSEDQRAYRVAVQQAEENFGIKSPNPLFFHWMQDPVAKAAVYLTDARSFYTTGVCAISAMEAALIISAFVYGCAY